MISSPVSIAARSVLCLSAAAWVMTAAAQLRPVAVGSLSAPAAQPTGSLVAGGLVGEHRARQEVSDSFSRAFQAENFAELERMYTQAVEGNERLPSGVFRASMMVRSLPDALALPDAFYDPDRAAARRAKHEHWTRIEAIAQRWAKAMPKSSAASVFLSEALVRHGYVFRGGGYASTISPEDMATFREYVEKAFLALAAREAYGARDPGWHTQMLKIGRLQGGQPAKRHAGVAKKAVAAFPYFYDIYFEASDGLTPQWGGSAEAVEEFARAAAERTKDREGNAVYARIYWNLASSFYGDPVRNGKAQWPRLRSGFDDLIKRYPDPWNLNTFARFACQAGDADTLRRLFALIGERIDLMAWDAQTVASCRASVK